MQKTKKKLPTTSKLIPLEREEQIVFVDWLELQKAAGNILRYTSIPNSTYTKSWKQKAENRAMGLRKGLCDMLLITSTGCMLFCELKRISGSTTSPEQKKWIHDINLCENCEAKVCFGAGEAIDFVQEFFPYERK